MTRHEEVELARWARDLENALKAIGRLLSDPTHPPRRRIEHVIGILEMYACAPAPRKETP